VKRISKQRHESALRKELRFWEKPGILESQDFRTRRYVPFLDQAAAEYGQDKIQNVLDAGCGPACMARHIPQGTKWYLDPLLESYRERFAHQLPREGEWISSKIEEANLREGFFDIVISLNALDHVQNPRLALQIIRRSLRQRGLFLLSMYTRGWLFSSLRNAQEFLGISTDRAHPYSYTRAGIEKELVGAGFTVDSIQVVVGERDRTEHVWICRTGAESS